MQYKLLVLDVDGTLLNSSHELTKNTLDAILKIEQAGVQVVLASGRPTYGLLPLAKALQLGQYNGYIISYNGSQIISASDGEVLFERRINPEMLPYIEKQANKHNFSMFTYHDNVLITNTAGNPHIEKEAALNKLKIIVEPDFSIALDFAPCNCVLVSDDEKELKKLEEHWHKRLSGSMDVFQSESYFLEVVPCGIDKATTLGALLDRLSYSPEEVIVIGDGVCDVSLLQSAGLSIAMGNAPQSVKSCADQITSSNDEDGVAVAIEKILNDAYPHNTTLADINKNELPTLMTTLGIQYTYISPNRIEATMPVDHRTRQPFGLLHGGASLALAETVAGLGSMQVCKPDEIAVGLQISANHIASAHDGDTVRAVGTLMHKGRSSHVWNIDIYTSTSKLISSVRIVNSILKRE